MWNIAKVLALYPDLIQAMVGAVVKMGLIPERLLWFGFYILAFFRAFLVWFFSGTLSTVKNYHSNLFFISFYSLIADPITLDHKYRWRIQNFLNRRALRCRDKPIILWSRKREFASPPSKKGWIGINKPEIWDLSNTMGIIHIEPYREGKDQTKRAILRRCEKVKKAGVW